jgi:hypothetical protein
MIATGDHSSVFLIPDDLDPPQPGHGGLFILI